MGCLIDFENGTAENKNKEIQGNTLYLFGGIHSFDHGCENWGTNDPALAHFVGDEAGQLVLGLTGGQEARVPLLFGYNLWFGANWRDAKLPFDGAGCIPAAQEMLKETLHLWGAFEGAEIYVLKIVGCEGLAWVRIEGKNGTDGIPVFTHAYFCSDKEPLAEEINGVSLAGKEAFFAEHTLAAGQPVSAHIKANLAALNRWLVTEEKDREQIQPYEMPEAYDGVQVRFFGAPAALAATGVFAENALELREKVDEEGFFHTSTKAAPSWRYDGFGTYLPDLGTYFTSLYSRDSGRGIMTLVQLGEVEKAQKAADMINDWMLWYPRQYPQMTFGGERIPGHYSVIPNQPMIYSDFLTGLGWPTQYTKERFGEEYKNLGNIEIDGHGLMMMANGILWRAAGKTKEWLATRWEILREGAEFICWCLDRPELSFAKNDVLYGETEATMSEKAGLFGYSLYGNIPCLLGMKSYCEMAAAMGETEKANCWEGYARRLENGVEKEFLQEQKQWDAGQFGFFHDPVPAMFADLYPLHNLPKQWMEYSRNTYPADLEKSCRGTYFAPKGLGYDHNMITQNALLLDQTADSGLLVENLIWLCYAPRLPKPYITPEGATVDAAQGWIRRQGDLGNLVQQAETVKTLLLLLGLSGGEEICWMPRLPKGWQVQFEKLPLVLANGRHILLRGSIAEDESGIAYTLEGDAPLPEMRLRLGPFGTEEKQVCVQNNGQEQLLETQPAGDARWAWAAWNAEESKLSMKVISR